MAATSLFLKIPHHMMIPEIDGLFWMIGLMVPLVFVQRLLHAEIMRVFLLLTRRINLALTFYTIIFFPGVVLHELSHWIMAKMLGVSTGNISLIPAWTDDGHLRMGFVEAAKVDPLRDSLIGFAPLLFGSFVVAFAGLAKLQVNLVWANFFNQDGSTFWVGIEEIYTQPDFWVWFYLIFAVSSTMMPSASDRQAWVWVGGIGVVMLGLAYWAGAGQWMRVNLAPIFNQGFVALAVVFGISLFINGVLLLPIYGIRRLISNLTGLQVVSK